RLKARHQTGHSRRQAVVNGPEQGGKINAVDETTGNRRMKKHIAFRPDTPTRQRPKCHDDSRDGKTHRHESEWFGIRHGKPGSDKPGGPKQDNHDGEQTGDHCKTLTFAARVIPLCGKRLSHKTDRSVEFAKQSPAFYEAA